MRKVAIVAVSLVAIAGAGLYALTLPAVMEPLFELTCRDMTQRCLVRARAIGHAWSYDDNSERATMWYRKAAEAGDTPSMFHLAWMLEQQAIAAMPAAHDKWVEARGSSAVPEMLAVDALFGQAAIWYRRAADKGFAPAMNNLGEIYKDGLRGSRNPQMAAQFFRKAAEAGNPVGAFICPWLSASEMASAAISRRPTDGRNGRLHRSSMRPISPNRSWNGRGSSGAMSLQHCASNCAPLPIPDLLRW